MGTCRIGDIRAQNAEWPHSFDHTSGEDFRRLLGCLKCAEYSVVSGELSYTLLPGDTFIS